MAHQLNLAGIAPAYPPGQAPAPDLGWAIAAARDKGRPDKGPPVARRFNISSPFAIIVPGASSVKPEKVWPIDHYVALAAELRRHGMSVVVVGGRDVSELAGCMAAAVDIVDLSAKTDLVDLAGLGAEAALSVGGDTGPTHLLAYAGSPGVMLMSRVSDPEHCAPRAAMDVLLSPDLASLSVEQVVDHLRQNLPHAFD